MQMIIYGIVDHLITIQQGRYPATGVRLLFRNRKDGKVINAAGMEPEAADTPWPTFTMKGYTAWTSTNGHIEKDLCARQHRYQWDDFETSSSFITRDANILQCFRPSDTSRVSLADVWAQTCPVGMIVEIVVRFTVSEGRVII
jgi:hypothetical protein